MPRLNGWRITAAPASRARSAGPSDQPPATTATSKSGACMRMSAIVFVIAEASLYAGTIASSLAMGGVWAVEGTSRPPPKQPAARSEVAKLPSPQSVAEAPRTPRISAPYASLRAVMVRRALINRYHWRGRFVPRRTAVGSRLRAACVCASRVDEKFERIEHLRDRITLHEA